MNRTQFWISGGVVLFSVSFIGWKSSRPPRVEAMIVRLENVATTLAVSGVLESSDRATVSSQLNIGHVKRVLVDIGDSVYVGDVLVILDDADLKPQLLAAEALIEQGEAQSHLQDVLAGTASKSVRLAKESLASLNELRSAASSAHTARGLALAKFQQAKVNLDRVVNSSRVEQVRISKAQLNRAVATAEQAEREAKRREVLYKEGAVSKEANEVAQTTLVTVNQDVEVAREQLRITAAPRPEDLLIAKSMVSEAQLALVGANELSALTQKVLSERLVNREKLVQAQGQLESAIASRKISEAAKQNGEAQRQSALSTQSKTIIRSPIAGKVAQRLVEPGQTVTGATPLMMIAGSKELRVRLNVEESTISLVKVGAKATIGFDAFPEIQISAVVSEIGSAANFELGSVEVRLKLLKRDSRLKPQLTADANIFIAEYSQVAVVPQGALVILGKDASVYVVEKGIVKARMVSWSRGNLGKIVINKGIEPGELVLTNPRGSALGSRVDVMVTAPGKAN